MGMYLDPGYDSFKRAIDSDIYIDKTGLISVLNKKIGTERCYFAVSRARRFGKSVAAGMLDAYYSMGCDSKDIFKPYEISRDPDFEKHLNKYHVLHFDVSTFLNKVLPNDNPISLMNNTILNEIKDAYPSIINESIKTIPDALSAIWKHDGHKFVIIIDEWECIIRDAKNDEQLIMDYLKYLRGFFKTEESKRFVALGYITGILPIKKYNGESAMNNFTEYTMISPKQLAPYFGFTDTEVTQMCDRDSIMDIDDVRRWYDGYLMTYITPDRSHELLHMYNPNSIVDAFTDGNCGSYWKNTGAFAGLNTFIGINMDGLKDSIIKMLSGEPCHVDTGTFQNDLTSFKSSDDVITALIHMGYLGYDPQTQDAFIPNEEVRDVFESAIKVSEWTDVIDTLKKSDSLLKATWNLDADAVAKTIEQSHQDYTSILEYHDENSLALAIMMSYYTARKYYMIIRELPSGKGFADIAFIPKAGETKPAMIIELKWDKDADSAINQIHNRNYSGKLKAYGGELLLIGINYTKKEKNYNCVIETYKPTENNYI